MSYGAITGQKPETPDIPQPGLKWELVKSGDFQLQSEPSGTLVESTFPVDGSEQFVVFKLKGKVRYHSSNTRYSANSFIYLGNLATSSSSTLMTFNINSNTTEDNNSGVYDGEASIVLSFEKTVTSNNNGNSLSQTVFTSVYNPSVIEVISYNAKPNSAPFKLGCSYSGDRNYIRVDSSNLHYDIYVGKISI